MAIALSDDPSRQLGKRGVGPAASTCHRTLKSPIVEVRQFARISAEARTRTTFLEALVALAASINAPPRAPATAEGDGDASADDITKQSLSRR